MKKAKACFADGGVVGSDGMTDAQREKKNAALRSLGMSNSAAPEPAPQPVAPPVQQQPQSRGLIGDAMNLIGNRQKQIDKAAGYSNGGKVGTKAYAYGGMTDGAVLDESGSNAAGLALIDAGRARQQAMNQDTTRKFSEVFGYAGGGLIKGIGTPTSDSIDGQVEETGEPIKVSTGERIVSAAQDKLLQRLAKAMGYKDVDAFFEAGTGKPVGPTIKGGKRGLAEGGSIYDPAYEELKKIPVQAFPNTVSAIQAGGDAAKSAADAGNYGAAIGQVGRGAINGIAGLGADVMNSAAYALDPAANALKTLVTGDNSPARQPAQVPSTAQKTQSALPQATYSNEGRSVPSQITKSNPGAIVDNEFSKDGRTYNVNPTSQTGISRVTAPGTSPLYTNINPEQAITGLKNQSIGQPAEEANLGLARYANANAINKLMIANRDKDIPAGGYGPGILGNGGLGTLPGGQSIEEWNRNVGVKTQIGLSPRGRIAYEDQAAKNEIHRQGQELASETSRQNAGLAAQVAGNRDNVTMRGQDLQAQSEAARINGNPVDNQTKQLALTQAQKISQLYDKAAAGDANAIKELQLRNPKEPNYSNRYITVPGGEETGPDGMTKIKRPSRVFDAQTNQWVNDGGQVASQQSAPASAIEYLKKNPNQAEAFKAKYGYIPSGL